MELFKKSKRGLVINEKLVDEVILVISEDNILSSGEVMSIFGYGGLVFYKNSKGNPVRAEYVLATKFDTTPSYMKDVDGMDGYKELHYGHGSYFAYTEVELDMTNNLFPVIKDGTNVEKFFQKFISGKLSSCVSYENQILVVLNNLELNQHLGRIPFLFYEIIIGETFIDSNGNPYRITKKGKPQQVSLKQKTLLSDTFSAVTFQDAKTSMVISLGKEDKEVSDVEYYSTI